MTIVSALLWENGKSGVQQNNIRKYTDAVRRNTVCDRTEKEYENLQKLICRIRLQ